MEATTVAAWWGAGLATVVLAWDVYKWSDQKPKIVFDVTPNYVMLQDGISDDKAIVYLEVTNRGAAPTTITNVAVQHYANVWKRVRGKPCFSAVVSEPTLGGGKRIPFQLGQNERWQGGMNQTEELLQRARTGYLVVEVYHSASSRPVRKRVTVPDDTTR